MTMKISLFALFVAASCTNACKDSTDLASCQGWKRAGFCEDAFSTMNTWCPKTCGYCGGPATEAPNTEAPNTRAPNTNGPKTDPPRTSAPTFPPTYPPQGSCGWSPVQQTRVVNGRTAKEGAWPWLASFGRRGSHFCGGTLIAPNWVLTAAHCAEFIKPDNLHEWSVKMGVHQHSANEPSVQKFSIKRVIISPVYKKNILRCLFCGDFALLELSRPATLNRRVGLACLPTQPHYPSASSKCYLAGWGSVKHPGPVVDVLQQARLPIVEQGKCKKAIHIEGVCAGYGTTKDPNACRGDSGGPFVCQGSDGRWVLEGVASFVVEYCKYYTEFSPVSKYLSWIHKHIGQ